MRQIKSRPFTGSAAAATRWVLSTAIALLLACLAIPSYAQDKAAAPQLKEKCLGCHDDADMKSEDGKSMTVLADDFGRSAHRKLDCAECHDAALGTKHPKNPLGPVKPQVCQDCHADEFKAIAGSIHGRRAAGDKAIKDCTGCHGSLHQVFKGGDPASPLSPVNQIKTCGGCHEEMMANYERSEHARGLLKSGLVAGSPSCSSCHGKHDIHPKSEVASTTSHAKIPDTCGKCHSGILREWADSAHGVLWKTANGGKTSGEAPVCSTCHEPHAIKRPDTAVGARAGGRPLRQLPREGRQVLPRQLPRQGERAEQPEGRRLRRLPHAARQPAGVGPALEHPPRPTWPRPAAPAMPTSTRPS